MGVFNGKTEDAIRVKWYANYSFVREATIDTLIRYVVKGIPPGGFMSAVLANDLFDAVGRADTDSMFELSAIVKMIWNDCPGSCWGDRDAVREWISNGGCPDG